jgi:serine/tyrosine/threonine adenylyltransferase
MNALKQDRHQNTPESGPKNNMGWKFDNSYARLPEFFHARVDPVPVRAPAMVMFNHKLALSLGLNAQALEGDAGALIFSGNQVPQGAMPLAMAYAGHQFGHFTMLGDGRAVLLGEQATPGGERRDIQLKGSGRTPFSRGGDGRAALGPMLREYVISEAMNALGIPTTRALAAVTTGEEVFREKALPGAILARTASSHIRAGTFEYAAAKGGKQDLKTLADYTINRHFPELLSAGEPYLEMFKRVMDRQASLVVKWQNVGFIHGVMNTDNMALCGETIDYGPCAFMDAYDPATVFSSIDHQGRYSYGSQPGIAAWNLARFAETLLPLLSPDSKKAAAVAQETLESFSGKIRKLWLSSMRAKLGLFNEDKDDNSLISSLLDCMRRNKADFTNTFRSLALEKMPDAPFFRDPSFLKWHQAWQERLKRQDKPMQEARELMRSRNPAVIPRNHLVEEALEAAVEEGDLTKTKLLLEVYSKPFEDLPPDWKRFGVPGPGDQVYRTFCGT